MIVGSTLGNVNKSLSSDPAQSVSPPRSSSLKAEPDAGITRAQSVHYSAGITRAQSVQYSAGITRAQSVHYIAGITRAVVHSVCTTLQV